MVSLLNEDIFSQTTPKVGAWATDSRSDEHADTYTVGLHPCLDLGQVSPEPGTHLGDMVPHLTSLVLTPCRADLPC